ncbi:hypothetical protein AB0B21_34780 [Streptomyces rimosus]|uniref:hypothetical protein n=1 Tax=Streptomyces rimosus TaxID=1927 RepID=UPI000518BE12|nr:hypothetical protein [Streptomyces rimosus]
MSFGSVTVPISLHAATGGGYYVAPNGPAATKPYALLCEAIATLALVRPMGDMLVLHSLH